MKRRCRFIIACMAAICLLWVNGLQAQPGPYFNGLHDSLAGRRIPVVRHIYETQLEWQDSTTVVNSLGALGKWAGSNGDFSLQAFSLILTGEYYKEQGHDKEKALLLLRQAVDLSQQHTQKAQEAAAYHSMGWVFYQQNKFPQAFEYMLRADNIIQHEIGYDQYPEAGRYLYDLGYLYYNFGNFTTAGHYLAEALHYPFTEPADPIRIYNTMGLVYRETGKFDSAVLYFKKAIQTATETNDRPWLGIASGNLGSVYFFRHQYEQAIPLLEADYQLSMDSHQWISAGHTLCLLADVDLQRRALPESAQKLDQVAMLLHKEDNPMLFLAYALAKAKYFWFSKHYDSAFIYLDTARILQQDITDKRSGLVFSQAEQKLSVERHLAQIQLMESEERTRLLLRNFIIIVVVLLLVIAAQFIIRQQVKRRRDKEMLDDAVGRLNFYMENVREKTQLLERFKKEMAQKNALLEQMEKEDIEEQLKNYSILTEEQWNEFRHLFEKVQKGFFDTLKKKYPALTAAEQRLLALMKLQLSKKEMSEMLGIAPDSIKKTRQRIRKKIDLPEEEDLEDMVKKI